MTEVLNKEEFNFKEECDNCGDLLSYQAKDLYHCANIMAWILVCPMCREEISILQERNVQQFGKELVQLLKDKEGRF